MTRFIVQFFQALIHRPLRADHRLSPVRSAPAQSKAVVCTRQPLDKAAQQAWSELLATWPQSQAVLPESVRRGSPDIHHAESLPAVDAALSSVSKRNVGKQVILRAGEDGLYAEVYA